MDLATNTTSPEGAHDSFVRDMLRDTARAFLDRHVTPEWVAERADGPGAAEPDALWPVIAEMGWTAVTVPEDRGGSGLSIGDQAVLFEEFGRALYPGPYFASIALAQPGLGTSAGVLDRLIAGTSAFTVGWREPDGARSLLDVEAVTCRAEQAGGQWRLFGAKIGVPSLEHADEVLVPARTDDGVALFVVELAADGVVATPGVTLDPTRREHSLRFERTLGVQVATPDVARGLLARMRVSALIAAAYEAIGVAERALADAVEYAKARHQFGKPVGAFQAVSGPLASRYEDIELARSLAEWAVRAAEREDPAADVAAAAAQAAAAQAAVDTAETAIQVLGAIGYTHEHGLHRCLRRALWLEAFEGGGRAQRARVADAILNGPPPPTVELMDDEAASSFRTSVRAWTRERLPTDRRGVDLITSREDYDRVKDEWQRAMADTGHLAAHWPRELGGQDASPLTTAIFREEAIRTHPRVSHGDGGSDLVAPLLLEYGTPEQQSRFLDGILRETEVWGQGFSEPDAGSDLAALKARAVRDGDEWVLNGTKTWCTYAPVAQWLFVLARTDPEATRHRGITCFIVDAAAPGVEIRPIVDIAGDVEFGEVFLTDVRVPDANVLGDVNAGWGVAIMTLANERVIESCEDIGELGFAFDRLLDCVREVPAGGRRAAEDPIVRDRLAALWSRLEAVRLTQHKSLVALQASDVPPPESEIIKLGWSELGQTVARLGAELFGAPGASETEQQVARFWRDAYLTSRSFTIYAGTTEILRSVIAERVLGLPRSR
jgi:alkylation response protein AidB-like acyl-CoA dehydrogenase